MTTHLAQHSIALMKANAIRLGNAQERRRIAAMDGAGSARVAALLREPGHLGAMELGYLLGSLHRFGPGRSEKLLRRSGINPVRLRRRLRELTARERDLLAAALEGRR